MKSFLNNKNGCDKMNLLVVCNDLKTLEISLIIKNIINLLRIIIPIVLISIVFYKLTYKYIKDDNFDVNKVFKVFIINSTISLVIYFLPLFIVNVISNTHTEYSSCINVSKNVVNNIKEINEKNNEFKKNYNGNIFMGDSRTVQLKDVVKEKDIIIAKNGGKIKEFLNHSITAKEILNNNSKYSYNIILNYGVNDLDDVYEYVIAYKDFIKEVGSKHRIYIVSVNPVDASKRINKNYKINEFNRIIKNELSNIDNVKYCDVNSLTNNSVWIDKYLKPDGLHYNETGNKFIYDSVISCMN